MNRSNLRLAGVGGLIFLWLCLGCKAPDDDYLVDIEGVPVGEAEFRLYLNRNMARVYNYYYQEWGVNANAQFWETKFGDNTPREYIKELVVSQLVSIKMQQQLAIQMGLTKDFNFDSLQHWWVQDNADRKFKKENGGIVYGPVERSFEDFYDYFHASLFNKLQETVYQKRFTPQPDILKGYYELNKNKWFEYIPEAQVEYLEWIYDGSLEKEQFMRKAEQAKAEILKGGDLSAMKARFPHSKYQSQSFVKSDEVLGEEDIELQLTNWALSLQTGEIKIFNGNYIIYLMRSIKQAEPKVYPYAEIERDVLWYYRKNHYTKLLDSLSQNASVRVNDAWYAGLKIQP